LYALLDCFTVSHWIATKGKIKRTNCYAVSSQKTNWEIAKQTKGKIEAYTRSAAAAAP